MLVRAISGAVLSIVGIVWIAQGAGAMHGSAMSGHHQYAGLGVVVLLVGLALIAWAWRRRGSTRR
jgi:protein-S-isoprenylcysteine O-methyltransferase Ste14